MHDNVVALFKHHSKREWSIPEIQAELHKNGDLFDPKALYNAINYFGKDREASPHFARPVSGSGLGCRARGRGHSRRWDNESERA